MFRPPKSAHGDEEETKEGKWIMEMGRLLEEEGVKCVVVFAAETETVDGAH